VVEVQVDLEQALDMQLLRVTHIQLQLVLVVLVVMVQHILRLVMQMQEVRMDLYQYLIQSLLLVVAVEQMVIIQGHQE
jgi:hypothetical protein